MSEETRLIVKCVLIVIVTAIVLVRYAKACQCEICEGPYGIYRRTPPRQARMQLCRYHAKLYDGARRFHRVRFATLRGLWRRAA